MQNLKIEHLHRDHEGVWRAFVTLGDDVADVDRAAGSWQLTRLGMRHDVMPAVAAELQAAVRKLERAEARKWSEGDCLECGRPRTLDARGLCVTCAAETPMFHTERDRVPAGKPLQAPPDQLRITAAQE